MLWPAASTTVVAFAMAVVILGPTERFADGVFGRTYDFFADNTSLCFTRTLSILLCDARRAEKVTRWCERVICESPNPLGQAVYLSLVLGGHASFVAGVETPLLDAGDASGWTARTFAAFTCAVVSWIAACCSDPGTITVDNHEKYAAAYPLDEVLYHKKECRTLGVDAPARSKFCRTTKRRVAKFDHFCVWINNTIGAWNLRYFLMFLASQLGLVVYVTCACVAGVRRDLDRHDAWSLEFAQKTKSGDRATLANDVKLLVRFVTFHYPVPIALGLFCAIVSVLLFAFLSYHLYLVARNVTTNETYKWDAVRASVKEAKEAAVASGKDEVVDWDEVLRNKYDVGVWENVLEMLRPPVKSEHPWRTPAFLGD